MKRPKKRENGDDNILPDIQDSKTAFKYEIWQNLRPMKFFKDSLVKSTYIYENGL